MRKIFHTGVTRSMTYVAMMLGNQCSRDDDVISTSLRKAGSVAHASPQERIEMNAAYMNWEGRGRKERGVLENTDTAYYISHRPTINWGKAGRRREVTRVGVVSLATYMMLESVWKMWTALLWVRTLYICKRRGEEGVRQQPWLSGADLGLQQHSQQLRQDDRGHVRYLQV